MRRVRYLSLPPLLLSLLLPISAFAAPWNETNFFTENANAPSSKVDAADLNGDGYIDVVFANGGGFNKGDDTSDQLQQAYFNDAGAMMTDVSLAIFGGIPYAGRAVKLRDVDYDGHIDIILGTTWESQSQLFLNDGAGNFSNETALNLPQGKASVGDIEVGDIDGDGDLDMLLTDWGDDSPVDLSSGGITQLWRQMGEPANFGDQGTAMFEDRTLAQMPNVPVRWSWDADFVDVDNDYDLDILVSAFAGDKLSVYLFANDGGTFKDATAGNMAQGKNALDVEPMNIDDDEFIDLVTLHDGLSGRNRVLINNKNGGFTDATDLVWPKLENPVSYDNMMAFYDYDSDTKVDMVLGALQTAQAKHPDRLMLNVAGKFKRWGAGQVPEFQALQEVKPSAGTFAIVLADFNKDNRLDVAMAQNENAFDKKILLANPDDPAFLADKAAPIFVNYEKLGQLMAGATEVLHVRCHDNKSPLMLHDFTQNDGLPYLEGWADQLPADLENNPGAKSVPGQWYGEYLWRISFQVPDADIFYYRICAIDAAGNKACTPINETEVTGGTATESDSMSSMSDTDTETDSITDTDTTMGASASDSTVTDSMTDPTVGTVSMTAPTESDSMSNSESNSAPTETFGTMSDSATVSDTATVSDADSSTISDTAIDSADVLDDDGCGCNTNGSPVQGVLSSLALLGLLGLRRRRSA
jgi:hypothetical protein